MTQTPLSADPTTAVAALRSGHDRLARFADGASADELDRRSMSSDWSVARVLAHLGSGAEIGLATVTSAPVENEVVWDRWNAMEAADIPALFVSADEQFVSWHEALSADELTGRQVHLPFLPAPISLVEAVGYRLSEVALHSWDVFAAFDPEAAVAPEATPLLIDRLPAMVALLGRFLPRETRPDQDTTIGVTTSVPERTFQLELGDQLRLAAADGSTAGAATSGELTLPAEAFVRLVAGRLPPGREAGAAVTGALSLDDLRRAFPGY